jgi:hypothetical protein
MLMEGATAVAEVAGLEHEYNVVTAALTSIGAGTAKTWQGPGASDPIDDLDSAIMTVLKAAKYGSLMGVGVIFGANAWKIAKNNANVRNRFIVGASRGNGQVGFAVPNDTNFGELLMGTPDCKVSYMVYDTAAEGLAASISFVLDSDVLIFARSQSPTRRDPSFMKTFRLMGRWMVPGSYVRDDGRVEVAKYDWSEDIKVTNSAAAVRLAIS